MSKQTKLLKGARLKMSVTATPVTSHVPEVSHSDPRGSSVKLYSTKLVQ